jgi:hypothetical protein
MSRNATALNYDFDPRKDGPLMLEARQIEAITKTDPC